MRLNGQKRPLRSGAHETFEKLTHPNAQSHLDRSQKLQLNRDLSVNVDFANIHFLQSRSNL
jgi:hypothetical protein